MELIVILIITILFVIISSGIISGSEAAILSISYPQAKELLTNSSNKRETSRAQALIIIKEHIHKYITTIVILNNVVNIIGSMIVGLIAAELFGKFYLGVVSGTLTFLIILFSEIIPKILGERHSSYIAPRISNTVFLLTKALAPLVWILNHLTHLIIGGKNDDSLVSEGVIREMAVLGKQEGSINTYESKLIENVFEMDDTDVYNIMVPKKNVITVDINANYERILNTAKKSGHTRFPVTEGHEIVGLVNVKDLFKYYDREKYFSVKDILRPIEFAPEVMKVSTLEQKLRRNRTHMAAVFNEHGDFVGVVTLEDIFEELVGEIEDEFDKEEDKQVKKIKEGRFLVDATYDIELLDDKFNLDLNPDGNSVTVNGYLTEKFGGIPKMGDEIKFENCKFLIIKANKKQILNVELILK